MTRIEVDFNNLVRQGQVCGSLRRVEGDIAEGQTVEVFDPAEDLSYEATVVEVDRESGRVYLQPHWEPAAQGAEVIGHVRVRQTGLCLAGVSTTNYARPRLLKITPRGLIRVADGAPGPASRQSISACVRGL